MSILIRCMKMPTDCHNCPLGFGGGCYCGTSADEYMCPDNGRADWCPLIPVPPHGRLIDADALIKEMDKQENAMYEHGHEFSFSFKSGGDVCTAWYNVEMMVDDAPTIIPASEEGE